MERSLSKRQFASSPVVYRNHNISQYSSDLELRIKMKTPCFLNAGTSWGLGHYLGNGYVVTAFHVVCNYASDTDILCIFPAESMFLIYSACFTQSCNVDRVRDQAFIRLLGDTTPLGDGIQSKISEIDEGEKIYFYTSTQEKKFQKQEGEILSLSGTDMFIMSVVGQPGDSGSAVYNAKGEVIGIYLGSFKGAKVPENRFGICSKISPQFLP